MSDWEQYIRGEILAKRPANGSSPNWEKMSGMLDLSATQQRRRRWLIAACLGGLLLLGVGLFTIPQQTLHRRYAVAIRPAAPECPAEQHGKAPVSLPQDQSGGGSAPVPNVITYAPSTPVAAAQPLLATDYLPEIQKRGSKRPEDQALHAMTAIPTVTRADRMSLSPVDSRIVETRIMSPPNRGKIQWELGLRGAASDFAMSRTVSEDGIITTETGYGSQPGGWLELACAIPGGWEVGGMIGGHSVWQPIEQQDGQAGDTFSDIWGRAFGGLIQVRKYFFRGKRIQPFLQAQSGMARQQLTHTDFSLDELGISPGNDPRTIWKFRKDLPASAVITSTRVARSVGFTTAGLGLHIQINDYLGLYASTQASYQWALHQPILLENIAGEGLYVEHALGLRVRI